jgi:hypothetical protein
MRYLGGHLGITVSALLDGQLDGASAERAWAHVHGCEICYRQVEREGWVKTQLAAMSGDEGPPPQLLGSLYGLGAEGSRADLAPHGHGPADGAVAWAAVHDLEHRGRGRRRAGIALAGAGSVSVAVLGFASLTGSTLGIGGAPTGPPTTALTGTGSPTPPPSTGFTTVIAPSVAAHGRVPDQVGGRGLSKGAPDGDESPGGDESPAGDESPGGEGVPLTDASPGQEQGEATNGLRP